ncbi:MarR family transcriptional regulator [Hydrogenophaga sp. PAMC20947]|uniref:MarR family winged helix-turn-helix transcriptional regulator n=1 Tax=Hydrogenophaga sp. PAMC20947 TaxID=2565558 RepID=UPI00109DBB33|nr:MarR family transcriptional regulator [Hydrogenophaga sp. PAMC20947]QCB46157.1 MarR family transcriptional regulator [Hydrogenophaga sp. PAMC20947]
MPRRSTPVQFYQAGTYSPQDSVGYMMKRAMLSMVHQVDKRLASLDLTSAQWVPLLRIRELGQATVAELARWSNTDAGAMTRLLDRLEKKGLCRRERSLTDRRVVHVSLTPEGDVALQSVPVVLADVTNLHLDGFSKAEWETLKGLLQRIVVNGDRLRDEG